MITNTIIWLLISILNQFLGLLPIVSLDTGVGGALVTVGTYIHAIAWFLPVDTFTLVVLLVGVVELGIAIFKAVTYGISLLPGKG